MMTRTVIIAINVGAGMLTFSVVNITLINICMEHINCHCMTIILVTASLMLINAHYSSVRDLPGYPSTTRLLQGTRLRHVRLL